MILSAHYLKPGCHQLVARVMERLQQRDDKMGAVASHFEAEMTCAWQNSLWDVNKQEKNSPKNVKKKLVYVDWKSFIINL